MAVGWARDGAVQERSTRKTKNGHSDRDILLTRLSTGLTLNIREAAESDLQAVLDVEARAFGKEEGPVILALVRDLLSDPTAMPLLSLVAESGGEAFGHVLFTRARVEGGGESVSAVLLAPLAVVPEAQSDGLGGRLVREGLRRLSQSGVDLAFVLGHPSYYPRHGFTPAGAHGLQAPYPIPEKNTGAWMVKALRSGVLGVIRGTVHCADALDRPEFWRE